MPRFFAFLRAINVGGRNITMEELRRLFEAMGFTGVESFIASGNIIFSTPAKDASKLAEKIEDRLRRSLDYEVKVFVRTMSELTAIAQFRPFPAPRLKSAQALNVAFLTAPLDRPTTKSIMAHKTPVDDFHVQGREVYWLCQTRQSDSPFFKVPFEKIIKAPATWRNFNTIARLAEKYCRLT
jgi:uncharacterized protein (DUF1697 family)